MSQKRKTKGGEITGTKNWWQKMSDWWNPDLTKCVFNYTVYTLIFIFICVIIMSILSNSSQGMYNIEKYFSRLVPPVFGIWINKMSTFLKYGIFLKIINIFKIL